MGRKKKVYYCKKCGKKLDRKTRSGLCFDCAMEKYIENLRQMKEKKGYYWHNWKMGMLKWCFRMLEKGSEEDKKRALGLLKKHFPDIHEKVIQ